MPSPIPEIRVFNNRFVNRRNAVRLTTALMMLCAAAFLFACATAPQLVPAPGAERLSPGGTIAVSSAGGVTVTVDPDAWRGGARIEKAVTPMRVKIENDSDSKLRIRYSDFAMVADDGQRYAALPPYEIRGSVTDPALAHRYSPVSRLGFTYDGFYVAPIYRFMYPSLAVYNAHLFHMDPVYYEHYYPYWSRARVELPTAEMLQVGLPEGVLDEDGVLAGFLYFENIGNDVSEVTFQADIVDVVSDEKIATVEIPFVMEKEEG